jgi:hypothetical protein
MSGRSKSRRLADTGLASRTGNGLALTRIGIAAAVPDGMSKNNGYRKTTHRREDGVRVYCSIEAIEVEVDLVRGGWRGSRFEEQRHTD